MSQFDDIEYEVVSKNLLADIKDFVDKMNLETEKLISQQIFPMNKSDEQGKRYVALSRDAIVNDFKLFLYQFCVTGRVYDSGEQTESEDENKQRRIKVLKIIHVFKVKVLEMQEHQKQLKAKTLQDI